MKKKLIKTFGLPLAIALATSVTSNTESFAHISKANSTLDRIHFLDTKGGGDAIIVESNGQFAMIDSGENIDYNVEYIKSYLNSIGAGHLDFFIATHIHSDHIGSIAKLIDAGVKVENLISTSIPEIKYYTKDSELPDNYKNPLSKYVSAIEYMDTKSGTTIKSDWKSDILYRDMLKSFYNQFNNKVSELKLNNYSRGEGYHILPTENSTLTIGDYKLTFNNAFNGCLEDYNNSNNLSILAKQDTNASSLFITVTDNKGYKIYLTGDGKGENIANLFNKNKSMYDKVLGYKLSHHGINDLTQFIDSLKTSNPDIKMFVMGALDSYKSSDYVSKKGIPLYATNSYRGTHNGAFTVDFYNGKINVNAEPAKFKWELKNGNWYLKLYNNYAKNQWVLLDGYYYYFDNSGKALTGWNFINGKWYYFAVESGKDFAGNYYPQCSMYNNSWVKTDNKWYYLNENGYMAKNKWIKEKTRWYYVGTDGAMLKGEHTINGCTYYFAPNSGHKSYSGKEYHDGQMYENEWLKLSNGKWKYFKKDGSMARNETLKIDGVTYAFKSDGTY